MGDLVCVPDAWLQPLLISAVAVIWEVPSGEASALSVHIKLKIKLKSTVIVKSEGIFVIVASEEVKLEKGMICQQNIVSM